MSRRKRKNETRDDCFPNAHCPLATLKRRSQIDFEIDFFEQILNRDPAYADVLRNLGELFSVKGCHRRALQVDWRLVSIRPRDPVANYNLACDYSLLGQYTEAFQTLRQAIQVGYRDLEHLLTDADLAPLHRHPEFDAIIQELREAATLSAE
jgi:tetratricopeptide (TPR) repeat protein